MFQKFAVWATLLVSLSQVALNLKELFHPLPEFKAEAALAHDAVMWSMFPYWCMISLAAAACLWVMYRKKNAGSK